MSQPKSQGQILAERRRSNAAGPHRVRKDGRRQSRRTRKDRAVRESLGR